MDIEPLKEKLGDETFAKLQTYVNDLTGQRDAARSESITGRKGLKAQLEAAQAAQAKLLEKLGIDSIDEIDTLPDTKGAAEAVKQYEAKMKRLERERDDAAKARDEAAGKYRQTLQRAAVAELARPLPQRDEVQVRLLPVRRAAPEHLVVLEQQDAPAVVERRPQLLGGEPAGRRRG